MTRSSTHPQAASLKSQRGFTLIGTIVSTVVAGAVITGAWVGFMSLQVHWRIAHAERVMDQYAASAMQELTNTISWCWGAKQTQSGRDPHWKFYLDDIVAERPMSASRWDQKFHIGPDRLLDVSFRPTTGILFNGIPPLWAVDRNRRSYVWTGRPGSSYNLLRTMDRRDRMTMEGLQIDFNRFTSYLPTNPAIENDELKRSQLVTVELTMHYTYKTSNWFGLGTRPYGSSYVRERKYFTQIAMRNWDVQNNVFRDEVMGLATDGG